MGFRIESTLNCIRGLPQIQRNLTNKEKRNYESKELNLKFELNKNIWPLI